MELHKFDMVVQLVVVLRVIRISLKLGLACGAEQYQRYEWLTTNASIYNLISAFEM